MQLHASCVAFQGRGVLIRGGSGSGKSTLSLALMAYGSDLIADDQTCIDLRDGWPMASAPAAVAGLIEARGIGLLTASHRPSARVELIVDMDQTEHDRLPPDRTFQLLGRTIALLHKSESPYFPAGILQYLKAGKAMR